MAYLRAEWESGLSPYLFKYDSRDLFKNVRKFFNKGALPHLREFDGRGPRNFPGYAPRSPLPTTKVLDTILGIPTTNFVEYVT